MAALGDTYLELKGDGHLWAVISKPDWDAENVVLVMFCTQKKFSQTDCILNAGDHAFINRPTSVEYHSAVIMTAARIADLIRWKQVKHHDPLRADVLGRIHAGAATADMMIEARDILRGQDLIE